MQPSTALNTSDHDLLIRVDANLGNLHTTINGVRSDVQALTSSIDSKIRDAVISKLDAQDFKDRKVYADDIHRDHETRLRSIEKDTDNFKGKYAIIAGIVVVVVSAIVSWGVSHLP